jgi:hypothetical protein
MPKRGRETSSKTARKTPVATEPRRAAPPPPRVFPAWAVPLAYALVCIIIFREFVLGPDNVLGSDTQALSYFARHFYTTFVSTFKTFPLWDPLVFGGLPFVDGMHGDIFYPPSIAFFLMDTATFWGWKMVLHVFLAGIFTYLWLRELGLRRETAFFGGLVYLAGPQLASLLLPGGDGKLFVSALAPLAFLLTERAVSRRRLASYAQLALGVALLVFTSHMQAAYFAIWGISLYALFRLAQWWRVEKNTGAVLAHLGAFALAGVVGVGAAAVQFFPPLGYLRTYSHRVERTLDADRADAYQYSTSYSLHAEEIASLVVPEFVGDNAGQSATGTTYWGRNAFKINHEYAGFLPLLFAPLLLLRRRSGRTWFFFGLAVLALLYGLGSDTPFFRLFYLIPGVRLFRAPSIIIFLYALSIATLGAFALERALDWARSSQEEARVVRRYLWIGAGVFGVLAVLANTGALMSVWQNIFNHPVDDGQRAALTTNLPLLKAGFWFVFLFALSAAAIWEGLARGIYGPILTVILVSGIVVIDEVRVSRPFVRATAQSNDPNNPMLLGHPLIDFFKERQKAGEVFRTVFFPGIQGLPNLVAAHGIEQLAGHHGNEMGRYRDLIGGDDSMPNMLPSQFRLMDVTNTTYMYTGVSVGGAGLVKIADNLYQKPDALPRAYVVGAVEVIADSLAVGRLLGGQFDYRTTALLPEALPSGITIQPGAQGTVEWLERTPNAFRMRVQSDRPALLMVLDNYYPQWRATVDGNPVEVMRANYTFRAIPIGAGQHEVQFRYDPSNLRMPALVSALLLALLGAVGIIMPLLTRMRARRPAPAE